MNVLIANYGNESLALIQWAIEQELENILVLSVDTAWQSVAWENHLTLVFDYLKKAGLAYQHIVPKSQFIDAVKDRGSFPSSKFQWCAPFLKGLPLNDALDDFDFSGQAILYLPKMKMTSKANASLISGESNEHYQDRIVNYPLLDFSLSQRDELINNAGFMPLSHRSDECFPCIHARKGDIERADLQDKKRLDLLEKQLNKKMFSHALTSHPTSTQAYDMGCGNIWGCGE